MLDDEISSRSYHGSHFCTKEGTTFDVIIVLGGGTPLSPVEPPKWVQDRAALAAKVFRSKCPFDDDEKESHILTLSGGSAHSTQFIDTQSGLPVFESAATAAFLMNEFGIPDRKLMFETSSYDTIGNAFFARTSFVDVQGWRKILVITSEVHMRRAEIIFRWIFGLDRASGHQKRHRARYELRFLASDDGALDEDVLEARRQREHKSVKNVVNLIAKWRSEEYDLKDMQKWMTSEHQLYSIKFSGRSDENVSVALRKSYGMFKI